MPVPGKNGRKAPVVKSIEPPPAAKPKDGLVLTRAVSLGVNPFDLTRISPIIMAGILRDPNHGHWRISDRTPIVVDKDVPDEQCVPFLCSLQTAALCIDLLRLECDEMRSGSMRAYVFKGKGWQRIPYNVKLTRTVGSSIVLNSDFFPIYEPIIPPTPPASSFTMRGTPARRARRPL
jgi:hypothetical protein